MLKKDLETASVLVNKLINETITSGGILSCFMIRHCEKPGTNDIAIQPTYNDTFYSIGKYIRVAEVCGCSYYVTVEKILTV